MLNYLPIIRISGEVAIAGITKHDSDITYQMKFQAFMWEPEDSSFKGQGMALAIVMRNLQLQTLMEKWFNTKVNLPWFSNMTVGMLSYIIIKLSLSVPVCLCVCVCLSGIGSQTMRNTVMKLLQVTQWDENNVPTKFHF